jgi:hypothetical protein
VQAMEIIAFVVIAAFVVHLAGGARTHRSHYRRHGAHPSLYYTYGRGWYGSVRIGGFRVGHKL